MVTVPELVNAGNVLAAAAAGGVRLDVDPLVVALVSEHGQETGSNANGSWIRFANGVQICWAMDHAWSSDSNGNWSWTFPQSFAATPAFWGTSYSATHDVVEFRSGSSSSAARVKMVTPSGGNHSSQTGLAAVFAVGRWK